MIVGHLRSPLAVALVLVGCSSSAVPAVEAGAADAGATDASVARADDAGAIEAGGDAADASPGIADEILGTLGGACGDVRVRLANAGPALVHNELTFVAGEAYARGSLSAGGQRLFDTPNAGGSSTESEVMSFEVLRACEGATLVKTETEIGYTPPDDAGASSITDLLVAIDGKKIGVSVTRAYKPPSQVLTDAEVKDLLEKKLVGINRSSVRVVPADRWVRQVLHVFAVSAAAEGAVDRVYPTLDATTRADTVVLVTRTAGGGFVYCDPDPPLGSECR